MTVVKMTAKATEQYSKLPLKIKARVMKVIERLEKWPQVSGAKPLRGNLAGQFRIRTGDYRVQFQVTSEGQVTLVLIVKVGHRDKFYD